MPPLFPDVSTYLREPLRVRSGEYVCPAGHPLADHPSVALADAEVPVD